MGQCGNGIQPGDKYTYFAIWAKIDCRPPDGFRSMEIEYDDRKRALTLEHRGLDFADATLVLEGDSFTVEDDRQDYGEQRFQTVGPLDGKIVMVVWTP